MAWRRDSLESSIDANTSTHLKFRLHGLTWRANDEVEAKKRGSGDIYKNFTLGS